MVQGSVVELRDSSVQGDCASIERADGARVILNGRTLRTPDDSSLMARRFQSGTQEWSTKTELNEAPADQAVAHEKFPRSITDNTSASDPDALSTSMDADDPRPIAEPVTPAWSAHLSDTSGGCRTLGGMCSNWWKSLCALVVLGGAVVVVARKFGYQLQRSVIVRWWRRAMLHR